MKKFIKFFFILVILSSGCLLSLLFLMTDDNPVVIETDKVTPQSLADSRRLLKQINHTLKTRGGNKSILIPFDSLNGIFALLNEILHGLSASYKELDDKLLISTTIKLPENPVGNYINIASQIGHDYSNTESNHTTIGKLSLSNKTVIKIVSQFIQILIEDSELPVIQPFIKNISIQNNSIKILLHPELNTQKILTYFQRAGKDLTENILPDIRLQHVQSYYDHLIASARHPKNKKTFTLFELLQMIMRLAAEKSDEFDAKSQNTSALIALALFTGDYNLKTTLNRFLNVKLSPYVNPKTVLNGREDLKLHFIYSSIIYIMSNSGISFSIGEIKEVSDSGKGGSGFSFIDIAADKAGIKFAQAATASNSSARLLQQRLSMSTNEKDIFPEVFAFSENISADKFKTLYTNRQSDEYKAILSEIDRRIDALFIYRKLPE